MMNRKITVKRLSASDLTLFETHFRKTPGSKIKAFNLDRAVLVDIFYPSLPDLVGMGHAPVSLTIRGPGPSEPHIVMRKVLKQQKNWRLDGEYIPAPYGHEERYAILAKDDFAIIEFIGEGLPNAAQIYLIAAGHADDAPLHTALNTVYSPQLSAHRGMLVAEPEKLIRIIRSAGLPQHHPASDLLDSDYLEDAAKGGHKGVTELRRRRGNRGVTLEEFERSRRKAEHIGRLGEELLNEHLASLKDQSLIEGFEWVADVNAIAPFDFTMARGKGDATRYLDAKSTSSAFGNPIHVSLSELHEMVDRGDHYDIYRLYEVREQTAKLRIAQGVGSFAHKVLASLVDLPAGVKVDSVAIDPLKLPFDEALDDEIDFTDIPDDQD